MLLSRQSIALGSELSQCTTDAETSVARFNDIVNIAILSSLIRIGEEFVVLLFLLSNKGLYVLAGFLLSLCFLCIQHSSGTRCTHDCNFS